MVSTVPLLTVFNYVKLVVTVLGLSVLYLILSDAIDLLSGNMYLQRCICFPFQLLLLTGYYYFICSCNLQWNFRNYILESRSHLTYTLFSLLYMPLYSLMYPNIFHYLCHNYNSLYIHILNENHSMIFWHICSFSLKFSFVVYYIKLFFFVFL